MEIVRPTVQEWCIPVQYTSSPEIIKNCLQEVLSEGMMNPQASTPDNEAMRKSQKEKIIKTIGGILFSRMKIIPERCVPLPRGSLRT